MRVWAVSWGFVPSKLRARRLSCGIINHGCRVCVRSEPLALTVAKWLALRCRGAKRRRRLLSALHVMFAPLSDGPRTVNLVDGVLRTVPLGARARYDLVVVDEAHHIYREPAWR